MALPTDFQSISSNSEPTSFSSSIKNIFSRPSHSNYKRQFKSRKISSRMSAILGGVILLFLTIGIAAALFLVQTKQDIRQWASGTGCDNGVAIGGTACRNQGEGVMFRCKDGSRPGASIWEEVSCNGGTCQGTSCQSNNVGGGNQNNPPPAQQTGQITATCAAGEWSCGSHCSTSSVRSTFNAVWCQGEARWKFEACQIGPEPTAKQPNCGQAGSDTPTPTPSGAGGTGTGGTTNLSNICSPESPTALYCRQNNSVGSPCSGSSALTCKIGVNGTRDSQGRPHCACVENNPAASTPTAAPTATPGTTATLAPTTTPGTGYCEGRCAYSCSSTENRTSGICGTSGHTCCMPKSNVAVTDQKVACYVLVNNGSSWTCNSRDLSKSECPNPSSGRGNAGDKTQDPNQCSQWRLKKIQEQQAANPPAPAPVESTPPADSGSGGTEANTSDITCYSVTISGDLHSAYYSNYLNRPSLIGDCRITKVQSHIHCITAGSAVRSRESCDVALNRAIFLLTNQPDKYRFNPSNNSCEVCNANSHNCPPNSTLYSTPEVCRNENTAQTVANQITKYLLFVNRGTDGTYSHSCLERKATRLIDIETECTRRPGCDSVYNSSTECDNSGNRKTSSLNVVPVETTKSTQNYYLLFVTRNNSNSGDSYSFNCATRPNTTLSTAQSECRNTGDNCSGTFTTLESCQNRGQQSIDTLNRGSEESGNDNTELICQFNYTDKCNEPWQISDKCGTIFDRKACPADQLIRECQQTDQNCTTTDGKSGKCALNDSGRFVCNLSDSADAPVQTQTNAGRCATSGAARNVASAICNLFNRDVNDDCVCVPRVCETTCNNLTCTCPNNCNQTTSVARGGMCTNQTVATSIEKNYVLESYPQTDGTWQYICSHREGTIRDLSTTCNNTTGTSGVKCRGVFQTAEACEARKTSLTQSETNNSITDLVCRMNETDVCNVDWQVKNECDTLYRKQACPANQMEMSCEQAGQSCNRPNNTIGTCELNQDNRFFCQEIQPAPAQTTNSRACATPGIQRTLGIVRCGLVQKDVADDCSCKNKENYICKTKYSQSCLTPWRTADFNCPREFGLLSCPKDNLRDNPKEDQAGCMYDSECLSGICHLGTSTNGTRLSTGMCVSACMDGCLTTNSTRINKESICFEECDPGGSSRTCEFTSLSGGTFNYFDQFEFCEDPTNRALKCENGSIEVTNCRSSEHCAITESGESQCVSNETTTPDVHSCTETCNHDNCTCPVECELDYTVRGNQCTPTSIETNCRTSTRQSCSVGWIAGPECPDEWNQKCPVLPSIEECHYAGQTCLSNSNFPESEGYCSYNSSTSAWTCQNKSYFDASCYHNYQCTTGNCSCQDATCTQKFCENPGEQFPDTNQQLSCRTSNNQYCTSGWVTRGNDNSCFQNQACLTINLHTDSRCTQIGESCTTNSSTAGYCAGFSQTSGSICSALKDVNHICTNNYECISGECDGNRCTAVETTIATTPREDLLPISTLCQNPDSIFSRAKALLCGGKGVNQDCSCSQLSSCQESCPSGTCNCPNTCQLRVTQQGQNCSFNRDNFWTDCFNQCIATNNTDPYSPITANLYNECTNRCNNITDSTDEVTENQNQDVTLTPNEVICRTSPAQTCSTGWFPDMDNICNNSFSAICRGTVGSDTSGCQRPNQSCYYAPTRSEGYCSEPTVNGYTCISKITNGGNCQNSSQCQSGVCNTGVCVPRIAKSSCKFTHPGRTEEIDFKDGDKFCENYSNTINTCNDGQIVREFCTGDTSCRYVNHNPTCVPNTVSVEELEQESRELVNCNTFQQSLCYLRNKPVCKYYQGDPTNQFTCEPVSEGEVATQEYCSLATHTSCLLKGGCVATNLGGICKADDHVTIFVVADVMTQNDAKLGFKYCLQTTAGNDNANIYLTRYPDSNFATLNECESQVNQYNQISQSANDYFYEDTTETTTCSSIENYYRENLFLHLQHIGVFNPEEESIANSFTCQFVRGEINSGILHSYCLPSYPVYDNVARTCKKS